MEKDVKGNDLVLRDNETNATIAVMQAYSPDLEGKEVRGNSLFVRDSETNALIPVVVVLGGNSETPIEIDSNDRNQENW